MTKLIEILTSNVVVSEMQVWQVAVVSLCIGASGGCGMALLFILWSKVFPK